MAKPDIFGQNPQKLPDSLSLLNRTFPKHFQWSWRGDSSTLWVGSETWDLRWSIEVTWRNRSCRRGFWCWLLRWNDHFLCLREWMTTSWWYERWTREVESFLAPVWLQSLQIQNKCAHNLWDPRKILTWMGIQRYNLPVEPRTIPVHGNFRTL